MVYGLHVKTNFSTSPVLFNLYHTDHISEVYRET
jgi:hypothetical protein